MALSEGAFRAEPDDVFRKELSDGIAQNLTCNRRLYAQRQTLVQLAPWVDGGEFRGLKEKAFRNKVFEFLFPSCCAFLPLDWSGLLRP